jgi:chemotaxis response regulator CheB
VSKTRRFSVVGSGARPQSLDPVRVLIVESEGTVRRLIGEAFGSHPRFKIVALARDVLESLRLARLYSPDVILLDVMMPRLTGLAALERLRRELPDTKIVVFSALLHDHSVALGSDALLDRVHRPLADLGMLLCDQLGLPRI